MQQQLTQPCKSTILKKKKKKTLSLLLCLYPTTGFPSPRKNSKSHCAHKHSSCSGLVDSSSILSRQLPSPRVHGASILALFMVFQQPQGLCTFCFCPKYSSLDVPWPAFCHPWFKAQTSLPRKKPTNPHLKYQPPDSSSS